MAKHVAGGLWPILPLRERLLSIPNAHGRPYPSLAADLEADVAIVGAGIVGLTAAHLLKAAGRTVAVLEARPCDLTILEHAMNVIADLPSVSIWNALRP